MNKTTSYQLKSNELILDVLALENLLGRLKARLFGEIKKNPPYSDKEILKAVREVRAELWKEKYEAKIKALSRN